MTWWQIYFLLYGFSLVYYFILEPLWYTIFDKSVESYEDAHSRAWSNEFWDDNNAESDSRTGSCFLLLLAPFLLMFVRLIKCINIFKLARYIRNKHLEKEYLKQEAERREKIISSIRFS